MTVLPRALVFNIATVAAVLLLLLLLALLLGLLLLPASLLFGLLLLALLPLTSLLLLALPLGVGLRLLDGGTWLGESLVGDFAGRRRIGHRCGTGHILKLRA